MAVLGDPTLRIPAHGFRLVVDTVGDIPLAGISGLELVLDGNIVQPVRLEWVRALNLHDQRVFEWWAAAREGDGFERGATLMFEKGGKDVGSLNLVGAMIRSWAIVGFDATAKDVNLYEKFVLSVRDVAPWRVSDHGIDLASEA